MDKNVRAAVQRADKYVRNKVYPCLVPGCTKTAIRSHAIQRASIAEALAHNGLVYTLRQSFNFLMNASHTTPMDVTSIGVNDASVFQGFCADHDSKLFAAAEKVPLKKSMSVPLHLRALSFEYCRRRRTVDFMRKMAEITSSADCRRRAEEMVPLNELFKDLYIGSVFAGVDSVEYFWIPLARNLQVSCCGCFQQNAESFDSTIAYNVISFANASFLLLTTFKVVERSLCANMTETSCVTAISEQGGKEIRHGNDEWHCSPGVTGAGTIRLSVR